MFRIKFALFASETISLYAKNPSLISFVRILILQPLDIEMHTFLFFLVGGLFLKKLYTNIRH